MVIDAIAEEWVVETMLTRKLYSTEEATDRGEEESTLYTCPACFSIIESPLKAPLTCSGCGLGLDISLIKQLHQEAEECALYGFSYRVYYEKEMKKKGRMTPKPRLAPPEVLVLLASWILAGIIGGYSKDLLSKLLRKAAESLTKRKFKDKKNLEPLLKGNIPEFMRAVAEYLALRKSVTFLDYVFPKLVWEVVSLSTAKLTPKKYDREVGRFLERKFKQRKGKILKRSIKIDPDKAPSEYDKEKLKRIREVGSLAVLKILSERPKTNVELQWLNMYSEIPIVTLKSMTRTQIVIEWMQRTLRKSTDFFEALEKAYKKNP